MPELDAEHRDQMANAILGRICNVSNLPEWMMVPALGRSMRPLADLVVDALAPLVAGWLADAWDAGYEAGYDTAIFEQRGLSTDSDAHEFPIRNPYRGGDDD